MIDDIVFAGLDALLGIGPGGGTEHNELKDVEEALRQRTTQVPRSAKRRGAYDHDRLVLELLESGGDAGLATAVREGDAAALRSRVPSPFSGLRRRRWVAGFNAADRRLAKECSRIRWRMQRAAG